MAKSIAVSFEVEGIQDLVQALQGLSESRFDARFDAVTKMTARNIYNRAMSPGGTPVDTGELRQSAGIDVEGKGKAIVGYSKEYAPHVEYGHRTRGGGYVAGQHYLQRNVEKEGPAYKKALLENLKRVL